MDLITQVFIKPNQEMTKEMAMKKLKDLMPNDPNKEEKAAASLGGSVASGFLVRNGNIYKRMR